MERSRLDEIGALINEAVTALCKVYASHYDIDVKPEFKVSVTDKKKEPENGD